MIQSVTRALDILEFLKLNPGGLGVTEIAQKLDVAKSTAHRLLASLEEQDYVQKTGKDSIYSLGLKFIEMAEVVTENLKIVDIARPLIEKLSRDTGEIVHLVMLDGNEVLYIDKVENASTIRIYSQIGRRGPLYCTGVGKAILAYLPEDEVDQLLAGITMQPFTEYTLTTPEELKQEFQTIRANAFAYDNEEHERGIRCVAAPIFDHTQKSRYAISITGPITRMSDDILREYIPWTKETAQAISRKMGFNPTKS
ncbi:IclR family transcriptional regulator [Paenibacillus glucanolyticus]|uniref:Glycerol operon regulatory protein n=1 Tax=Paenibacillus glucanolyticus TaxID=59843 RepID=A0A163ENP9_9BACL|nr:IclR family transcriptional regulator [Paenibacillus glucanolyticus]KZS43911.1 IclR family transcriptional regulator [Paenibacillus glucanolyticus]